MVNSKCYTFIPNFSCQLEHNPPLPHHRLPHSPEGNIYRNTNGCTLQCTLQLYKAKSNNGQCMLGYTPTSVHIYMYEEWATTLKATSLRKIQRLQQMKIYTSVDILDPARTRIYLGKITTFSFEKKFSNSTPLQ